MSSLYKRAERDAWMQALLIVVEGQVRSALQDHPEWVAEAVTDRKGRRKAPDPHKIARSIAKRVTGDVAAQWQRLDALKSVTREADRSETRAGAVRDPVEERKPEGS